MAGSLSGYNNKYDTITNGVIRYNKYSDLVNAGKFNEPYCKSDILK